MAARIRRCLVLVVFPLVVVNSLSKSLLILGLGRVGSEVAKVSITIGRGDNEAPLWERVYGTVRNTGSNNNLPLPPHTLDDGSSQICRLAFDVAEIRKVLPECTHVLVTIPPQPPSAELESVLSSVADYLPRCAWLGLVSTTGVYGDHQGNWVNEDSECNILCDPSSNSAAEYLLYERAWAQRAQQAAASTLCIFRCAGIYGPDRSVLHTVFRKGLAGRTSPVSDPVSDVTNRIHVQDLARAVVHAMRRFSTTNMDSTTPLVRVFNLADDLPESRSVVMNYAVTLLERIGVDVTTWVREDDVGETTLNMKREIRRASESKRVCNHRMRTELLAEGLLYPTYKEGLEAILADISNPWWLRS